MKKNYHYSLICICILSIAFAACSKINDTYHDFWNNGEKIYPASPDSLKVFSGKNRAELSWLIFGDPSLSRAIIYWNNKNDSLEVPIKHSNDGSVDTMRVMLENLPEGNYSFDIYTFDKDNNRSVEANITGKVYGDEYIKSLLTRLVDNTAFVNDTLHIQWGDPADNTSIGTEVVYEDYNGNEVHRMVSADADTTMITDYDNSLSRYFKYRTLFLPDSTAIDTFYTAYDSVRVLGPRTNLPKAGWSITVSSYDNRNGRKDRLPEKLIDENTATAWVNLVGSSSFPHTAVIDMGSVQTDIFGVSLFTGGTAENPRSMSVYTSDDNVNWQPFGIEDIAQIRNGWQYFDFSQPQTFRYLKLIFETSYGSPNIILYEAGVYTR